TDGGDVVGHVGQLVDAFLHGVLLAKDAEMRLHDVLHGGAHTARVLAITVVAQGIETFQNPVFAGLRCGRRIRVRVDDVGGMQGGGAAEHDQIQQAVGTQPVGAVHRHAGRFTHGHETGHHGVVVAALRVHDFAIQIGGDAAHGVMHRGHDRNRLLVGVDVQEGAHRVDDAGQFAVQRFVVQVFQMQQDVVAVVAAAAAFAHLHTGGV